MKAKKIDIEKFIISEIKSISKKENLNLQLKEGRKNDVDLESDFEKVEPSEFAEEAKEAKVLSEEVTRMKELLNFNNPLLKK